MRNFILRLVVNALALSAAAWLVDGVHLTGEFWSLALVALVFGLVNAILKPVLMLLSLPFLFLTLGLFTLVINAGLLYLTAEIVDGLSVDGAGPAFVGGLVISVTAMLLNAVLKDEKKK